MCHESARPLTFESMLTDPLVRMMMQADGVTVQDMLSVMQVARDAVAAREMQTLRRVLTAPAAMNAQA